jgi:hypothetical protein
MAITGYYLSELLHSEFIIWARFLIAPYPTAAGFGVPVNPNSQWDAYLSVKAIREIATGLFITILMIDGSIASSVSFGRESYRKTRLEPLGCSHRLSQGAATHEREYPRRRDLF